MKLFLLALLVASAAAAIKDDLIDCGSHGSVDDVMVEGCTGLPCIFKPDTVYESTIDFTTAKDSEVVHFVVSSLFGDDSFVIIDEAVATDIIGNRPYKLEYTLLITDLFFGDVLFQVELLDKAADHKIICSIAHCRIEAAVYF